MPAVQPAELWMESGRWDHFGPELLRLRDRHERDFCVGPTHEEVITDVVRREVRSYRQLPLNLYQIQTKFRDEVRPRFGVMRAREFIMKDAYSFDLDEAGSRRSYEAMRDAYRCIFSRTGLDFRVVEADSGAIGGSRSEEFHVLADSGEDDIAFNDAGTYAANLELTPAPPPPARGAATETMREVSTPDVRTIEDVSRLLGVPPARCLKTLFVEGDDGPVALVLRGDHELNLVKASRLEGVRTPVALAPPEAVREAAGGRGRRGGAGRARRSGRRRPVGGRRRGLRLRGEPRRRPPRRRQLGAGCARADGRGSPQRRRGRSEPGRPWRHLHSPRHRGRPRVPARAQVQRVDACGLPRRGRPRPHPGDGLLRDRGQPHRGRRHRAEPRRERHRLAGRHRAVRGGPPPDERAPLRAGARALRGPLRGAAGGRRRGPAGRPGESGPGSCSRRWSSSASPHRLVLGERRLDEGSIEYRSRRGGETELVPSTRRRPTSPPASTAARPPPDPLDAPPGPEPRLTSVRETRSPRGSRRR